ncbi:MAG: hypothetical protein AAFV07_07890 [Bacteroidota bacterium]
MQVCTGLIMSLLSPALFADAGETTVLATEYPEVRLLLADSFSVPSEAEQMRLLENGFDVPILHLGPMRDQVPLHLCIVIDHSSAMLQAGPDTVISLDQPAADNRPWLFHAQEAIGKVVSQLNPTLDTLHLIGTRQETAEVYSVAAGDFDPVLLQPGNLSESRLLYEAWQTGLESLLGLQGRKMLLSFSVGPDQGSETPLQTVAGSARLQRVPMWVFELGQTSSRDSSTSSDINRLRHIDVPEPANLAAALQTWHQETFPTWELAYKSQAPLDADNRERALLLLNDADTLLKARFRLIMRENVVSGVEVIQSTSVPPVRPRSEAPSLWFIIGAVSISIAAVVWLIRARLQRGRADLVEPAIIRLKPSLKRRKLLVVVNLPRRDLPAQFQIVTQGGKPLKELIFKPGQRRRRAKLPELPAGLYQCHLVQGGRKSESVELTWDVDV